FGESCEQASTSGQEIRRFYPDADSCAADLSAHSGHVERNQAAREAGEHGEDRVRAGRGAKVKDDTIKDTRTLHAGRSTRRMRTAYSAGIYLQVESVKQVFLAGLRS